MDERKGSANIITISLPIPRTRTKDQKPVWKPDHLTEKINDNDDQSGKMIPEKKGQRKV